MLTRMIHRVLNALFRRDVFPDYVVEDTFARWLIWKFKSKKRLYLHHFYPQTDLYSHSHARGMISIGLAGGYSEETWTDDSPEGVSKGMTRWQAPWVRHFDAGFRHRFTVEHGGRAWTLCLIDHEAHDWGFWTPEGEFIHWTERTVDEGHSRDEYGNQILDHA